MLKWPRDSAKFTRMIKNNDTCGQRVPKVDRRAVAQQELSRVLDNACVAGFHGSASVTVTVQDGHIQYTRIAVERMVK